MPAIPMRTFLKPNNYKLIILISFIFLFFFKEINKAEFPVYRVILDAGHGGFSLAPKEKHGDRYDSISNKYLSDYHAGTYLGTHEERIITYNIAAKVKDILDLTADESNFNKLKEILKKYSNDNPARIIFEVKLSRIKSLSLKEINNDDPNAEYRLFDFIDRTGNKKHGRISVINSYKPHLVVSLHCDSMAPIYYRGINPVITAPYSLLYNGLSYLKGDDKKAFFFKSAYTDWFAESVKRTGFRWFLKDSSVYFTGYPVNNNGKTENKFTGYIYNMVKWQYNDAPGWENTARNHPKNTQYAIDPKDFIPEGKFWEREKSIYESYRRDGGPEGFGGDNLYASTEIIRYLLFSLYQSGNNHPNQKLGKPYISVWSLPILVNAITAYIELGYLRRDRDRFILTKKQNEIAEGIAVGIYSLFAGLTLKSEKYKYLPNGKNIDLKKYMLPTGQSYFDIVNP